MAQERRQAHPEAIRTFRQYGLARTAVPRVTAQQAAVGEMYESDVADIEGFINGMGFVCEVKAGVSSFRFADFTEGQREWMEIWAYGRASYPYHEERRAPARVRGWLWLCVGKHPPHYNPAKYQPRRTWLVEYWAWRATEIVVQEEITRAGEPTKSVPYTWLCDKMSHWELHWRGDGLWTIPPEHQFHLAYCQVSSLAA